MSNVSQLIRAMKPAERKKIKSQLFPFNGRDSMKTVEEPRPVRCAECEGAGTLERVVGEDRSGMGGISPVTRDERCEECEQGLVTCEDCGATPSFKVGGDVLCEDCINDMED